VEGRGRGQEKNMMSPVFLVVWWERELYDGVVERGEPESRKPIFSMGSTALMVETRHSSGSERSVRESMLINPSLPAVTISALLLGRTLTYWGNERGEKEKRKRKKEKKRKKKEKRKKKKEKRKRKKKKKNQNLSHILRMNEKICHRFQKRRSFAYIPECYAFPKTCCDNWGRRYLR
jgi:hypothetical protein